MGSPIKQVSTKKWLKQVNAETCLSHLFWGPSGTKVGYEIKLLCKYWIGVTPSIFLKEA
jgi:hypothetical protein